MKNRASGNLQHRDQNVAVRLLLIALLALALIGAMHWAMNVTNANAKQISSNLEQMKLHFDENTAPNGQGHGHSTEGVKSSYSGPTIDPAGNAPVTRHKP